MVDELVDRYGPLPEPAQRLVAVARLRLLCRQFGVTELAVTGSSSAATLRVAPLTLADSAQVRLARDIAGGALPRDDGDGSGARPSVRRQRGSTPDP